MVVVGGAGFDVTAVKQNRFSGQRESKIDWTHTIAVEHRGGKESYAQSEARESDLDNKLVPVLPGSLLHVQHYPDLLREFCARVAVLVPGGGLRCARDEVPPVQGRRAGSPVCGAQEWTTEHRREREEAHVGKWAAMVELRRDRAGG